MSRRPVPARRGATKADESASGGHYPFQVPQYTTARDRPPLCFLTWIVSLAAAAMSLALRLTLEPIMAYSNRLAEPTYPQ